MKKLLITLLVVGIPAWYFIAKKSVESPQVLVQTENNEIPSQTEKTQETKTNESKNNENKDEESKASTASSSKKLSLPQEESEEEGQIIGQEISQLKIPSSDDLRDEIKEDPHVTPPSLLKFADKVTPQVLNALNDVGESKKVVDFLENCAQGKSPDQVAMSIRAFCLNKAAKIANKYPDLYKNRVDQLRASVPQHVRNLEETLQ